MQLYRLVHDGSRILAIAEDVGNTSTPHTVIVGNHLVLMREVRRLKLSDPDGQMSTMPCPTYLVLSAWKAKAVLEKIPHPLAGNMKLAAAQAIVNMPDGEQKIDISNAWEANADFEIDSPTIQFFAEGLGMSYEDLYALFQLGGSLTL